ncbi:21579_t:CDS:2, partial [Cetraspora pellucida]
ACIMGQTLSEPVKEKHTVSGKDNRILYASSAMQGWRISMEDAHTATLTLLDKKNYSYFGVYDGHGGQNVAKYSGNNLHARIAKDDKFDTDLEKAIQNGFLDTDEDLKKDPQFANDPSGCTAVISIITPKNEIYVGNAGDSRAVLSVDGEAQPMSEDHKPRITDAGGFVEFGRVNGSVFDKLFLVIYYITCSSQSIDMVAFSRNLALSRALGDFEFKQVPGRSPREQIVTAYPDVKKAEIKPETEFLVLACDGIWDCLSSQHVVSFIRKNISENKDLRKACEDLMERCLAKDSELGGIGCDNMTVIIVGFLHNKSEKEWYEWMAKRYEDKGPKYQDDVRPPKEEHNLNGENADEDMGINAPDDDLTLDNERINSSDSMKSTDSNRSDSIDSNSSDDSNGNSESLSGNNNSGTGVSRSLQQTTMQPKESKVAENTPSAGRQKTPPI